MKSLVTENSITAEIGLIKHVISSIRVKEYHVDGLEQAEKTLEKLKGFPITDENKDELYNRLANMYQNLYSNYIQACQAERAHNPGRMDYFDDTKEI